MKTRLQLVCALAILALLPRCGADSAGAGNGSETPNAAMGVLYAEDGSLASGATVRFVAVGADPRTAAAAATTTTDPNGRYFVAELDPGIYNVLADKADARSFTDSVAITAHDTTECPDDTLRPVGSVCGVVKFAADTTGEIYVLALGAGVFATADAAGRFCLADLAPGTYSVRVFTSIVGYSRDTAIMVLRDTTTVLADTLWVNSTELPVPTGLRVEHDSLRIVVALSWNSTAFGATDRYRVYRSCVDSPAALLTPLPTPDTVYRDSTAAEGVTYSYQVAFVDANGNQGALGRPVSTRLSSAFHVTDTVLTLSGELGAFAADSNGTIYVTDLGANAIAVYSPSGVRVRDWVSPRRLAMDGVRANNLMIDSRHRVFVYAYYDSITVYDTLGNRLTAYGGLIGSCEGMVTHGDSLFVACEQPSRKVLVFGPEGNQVTAYGSGWTVSDNFWSMAVNSEGRLCIYGGYGPTTSLNRNSIAQVDLGGAALASLWVGRNLPDGVLSENDGKYLLASASAVQSLTAGGELLYRFGLPSAPAKAIREATGSVLVALRSGSVVRYALNQ